MIAGARCVLADSKVIIGAAMKKLTIWDRETMLSQAPRTLDLEGAPAITVLSAVCFVFSYLQAINDQKSAILPDNRVLLVNNNPGGHLFQV